MLPYQTLAHQRSPGGLDRLGKLVTASFGPRVTYRELIQPDWGTNYVP